MRFYSTRLAISATLALLPVAPLSAQAQGYGVCSAEGKASATGTDHIGFITPIFPVAGWDEQLGKDPARGEERAAMHRLLTIQFFAALNRARSFPDKKDAFCGIYTRVADAEAGRAWRDSTVKRRVQSLRPFPFTYTPTGEPAGPDLIATWDWIESMLPTMSDAPHRLAGHSLYVAHTWLATDKQVIDVVEVRLGMTRAIVSRIMNGRPVIVFSGNFQTTRHRSSSAAPLPSRVATATLHFRPGIDEGEVARLVKAFRQAATLAGADLAPADLF